MTLRYYTPEHSFPITLTPGIRVMGNYFFNLMLVTGKEKSALFEAGVSGVTDAVIAQMDALGIEPDYLIVSHPHADHITGLPGLMERYPSARVIAGLGAREFAGHPKAGPALVKEDKCISSGLQKMGIQPGRPSLEDPPNLSGVQEIAKETRIDLGGDMTLDLIPVKGHSPASLIARVPMDRAVFCSDALGFHFPGRAFWPLFFTDAKDYLDTLELIKSFKSTILCPAHQGPITGINASHAPDRALKEARDIIERINHAQVSDEELIDQLFEESYRDEFRLYTKTNIMNCTRLMIKRSRQI